MAMPTPRDNFKIFIGSTDGVQIGTIAACETRANASERPPTDYTALQVHITGWHWPALAGIGAGDGNRNGNRKYRRRGLAFWNHEVASATGAACDFCVKNGATRANASQCGHWGRAPIR
jgi:hypothetical protein